MCGRYTVTQNIDILRERFLIDEVQGDILLPRYNIAPSQNSLVVRYLENKRVLTQYQWGLVPFWSKENASKRIINSRSESLIDKKMYKNMITQGRCLVVADGFYEWVGEDAARVPVRIQLKSGNPFSFAGVSSSWTDSKGVKIPTFSIVTLASEGHGLMNEIHHRMPVMLGDDDEKIWLQSNESPEFILPKVLKQYPENLMKKFEVSKYVNTPKNDDSKCIQPI